MTSAARSDPWPLKELFRPKELALLRPPLAVAERLATPVNVSKKKLAERVGVIEDEDGLIGLEIVSSALFSDPRGALARTFYRRVFAVKGVRSIAVDSALRRAEIFFHPESGDPAASVGELSAAFRGGDINGARSVEVAQYLGRGPAFRLSRYGDWVSTWTVKHEIPGRIRLYNPALFRRRELRQSIEAELTNTLGVDRFSTQELTGGVLIHYNSRQIQKRQIIEILDAALEKATDKGPSPVDLDLPISVASVVLAAAGRFVFPALTPLSAAVFLYSVIPSFKGAYHVAFKEKRLGVDVLDAIVVAACLATNQILAGSAL